MPLASSLPVELVHTILEAHPLTPDGEPDRRLLQSSSLVCNAWSTPAQRLLFTNLVLRSHTDFHAICDALRQPSLANAVRTLRVVLDYNQPRGLRQQHLAAVVVLCPRLKSINLSVFGSANDDSVNDEYSNDIIMDDFDSLRVGTGAPSQHRVHCPKLNLSLVEALAKSPITSFHLSNWSTDTLSLHSLLASLPAVKLLSITGTPPSVPISASNHPCSLNFSHLRINFQQAPSINFLRWLLENSRDTLTALDLERVSGSDASIGLLDQLTTTHGPFLRSLVLPSCITPTELKHFQRCTKLRAVAFRTPYVSTAVFKHLLADAHPTPLEEMYLCVDRNTALSPVIELVKSKDTLQSLAVCFWEKDMKKLRLWGSLKMACAVRGVELKVVERLSEYKALIKSNFEMI